MAEFHEDNLSQEAKEFHRIIQSVIEELEAVDWYNQRADVTDDPQIKAIVEHNRDEEIEHACMGLEWLRRNYKVFDEELNTYLFTSGDITAIEEGEEAEDAEEASNNSGTQSLGIQSLKGGNN